MLSLPESFAGRPPSSGHVDPIVHAELHSALAAYRDLEAIAKELA